MAFVDQDGLVLARRNLPTLDAANNGLDHFRHNRVCVFLMVGEVNVVSTQLAAAPAVECPDMHLVRDTLARHPVDQSSRKRLVVAQHQYRFGAHLGELLGAVAENQGLPRTRDAVDYAVTFAEAPRQLLLLKIHHPHQVRDLDRRKLILLEEPFLRTGQADLGEQMPPHPIKLRQRQVAVETNRKHFPEPLLKCFHIHGLKHFVLADYPLRLDYFGETGTFESPSRNVGKYHAIGPGKGQPSFHLAAGKRQLFVALQNANYSVSVLAGLFERIEDVLESARGKDRRVGLGYRLDGVRLPVLYFQDQKATMGMQHDEIGMAVRRTDRNVVPTQVIRFELGFKALREPSLARRHAPRTRSVAWNQCCHSVALIFLVGNDIVILHAARRSKALLCGYRDRER